MISKLTNSLTGETIEFDYNKVIEADEAPINYDAIKQFKEDVKKVEQCIITNM